MVTILPIPGKRSVENLVRNYQRSLAGRCNQSQTTPVVTEPLADLAFSLLLEVTRETSSTCRGYRACTATKRLLRYTEIAEAFSVSLQAAGLSPFLTTTKCELLFSQCFSMWRQRPRWSRRVSTQLTWSCSFRWFSTRQPLNSIRSLLCSQTNIRSLSDQSTELREGIVFRIHQHQSATLRLSISWSDLMFFNFRYKMISLSAETELPWRCGKLRLQFLQLHDLCPADNECSGGCQQQHQ